MLAAALALLALALYWPATGHEFVDYDDGMYVTENPRIAQGLTHENIAWAFTTTEAVNWRAITWRRCSGTARIEWGRRSRAGWARAGPWTRTTTIPS